VRPVTATERLVSPTTLTIVEESRLIVLYPRRLTMAKARNTTDA